MTRTCWLHIGTHKTGTTTIQTAFRGYRDSGLVYLPMRNANHTVYMVSLFHSAPEKVYRELRKVRFAPDVTRKRQSLKTKLERILQSDRRDVIISSEGMSTPHAPLDPADIMAFLSPFFDRVRVIVYLREPRAFTTSLVLQRIKSRPRPFEPDKVNVAYRMRLQPWLETVGRENMEIRLFDRAAFKDEDLLTDFASVVGATGRLRRTSSSNTSPSAEAAALANYVLRNDETQLRWLKAREALKYPGQPLALDPDMLDRRIAAQKDAIAYAEDLLGRAFPAYRLPEEAVIVRDDASLQALAEQHLPAFRRRMWPRVARAMPLSVLRFYRMW